MLALLPLVEAGDVVRTALTVFGAALSGLAREFGGKRSQLIDGAYLT